MYLGIFSTLKELFMHVLSHVLNVIDALRDFPHVRCDSYPVTPPAQQVMIGRIRWIELYCTFNVFLSKKENLDLWHFPVKERKSGFMTFYLLPPNNHYQQYMWLVNIIQMTLTTASWNLIFQYYLEYVTVLDLLLSRLIITNTS